MKLMTEDLAKTIPGLYKTEELTNPMVQCKFFLPGTQWTWYVTEYDGEDVCFGFVVGDYPELGYFTISELESVNGPMALRVERDRFFRPVPLKQIMQQFGK